MLYYNLILSIITESYSMIAVCCMIGLNKLNANSFGDFIQSLSTIFGLLVLIVYPVLVFRVLKKSWKENLNQTKEKFQPIF
jgi:flagellar biosynthesis protein FliR